MLCRIYVDKDIYSSVKFRCDSSAPEVIAAAIHRRILALIEQDKSQLYEAVKKAMTPEQLTLPFACEQYVFNFLQRTYPSSSPENNTKRSKQLQRILSRFPATPITKLTKRQVNSILTELHATDEAIKLCYLFVEYLLQMRLCLGSNPFTPPEAKAHPANTAFQRQELGDAVFERMFELLSKSLSATNMVIALQASGFPLADIRTLTWGDIEFMAGYKDFMIVHIRRDYAALSKHDYSRPAIPDTALYCKRVYHSLLSERSKEDLAKEPLLPSGIENKIIFNEIRNILVRAGYSGELSAPGRPGADASDIPSRILQTNYQRMLLTKAGLKDDPDTYAFLSGMLFENSTFTSYESHTSEKAMRRLYQILQPVSTRKKLGKKPGMQKKGGQLCFAAWPVTNHEAAQITGWVRVRPHQRLEIRAAHGVRGKLTFSHDPIDE